MSPILKGLAELSENSPLAAAIRRLTAAVDRVETAIESHRIAGEEAELMDRQLQALGDDRSRLAVDLDHATARAERLEAANKEVARRIGGAMETIRAVLADRQV